jgi:arginine-tRNA-protein transferase
MKPFVSTLYPSKLTLQEFDAFLADGYFPSGQLLQALSHLVRQFMWVLEVNKVYRTRFVVDEVKAHKSHQSITKLNKNFRIEIQDFNEIGQEFEELYQKYLAHINFNCADTLLENLEVNNNNQSVFKRIAISVYDQDKLIAADILYAGVESLASVLCFYDPAYAKNSLGKYTMLIAIDYMKQQGYKYYYIGYLINGDSKFDYKLFLGKESAYVFNIENRTWDKFDSSILIPIYYTDAERMNIALEINGFYAA